MSHYSIEFFLSAFHLNCMPFFIVVRARLCRSLFVLSVVCLGVCVWSLALRLKNSMMHATLLSPDKSKRNTYDYDSNGIKTNALKRRWKRRPRWRCVHVCDDCCEWRWIKSQLTRSLNKIGEVFFFRLSCELKRKLTIYLRLQSTNNRIEVVISGVCRCVCVHVSVRFRSLSCAYDCHVRKVSNWVRPVKCMLKADNAIRKWPNFDMLIRMRLNIHFGKQRQHSTNNNIIIDTQTHASPTD